MIELLCEFTLWRLLRFFAEKTRNDNGEKFRISKTIQLKFGNQMPTISHKTSIR
ncbi:MULTISPECIES: hypothetical protein [unclassified Campylobacter]|uniref:hypothetical protein n=1 Tax=unclassified Campylobacter TaxID=2593542 RepID=UPI0022E9AA3C|nr:MULTISPECIES: hypothetical protein [unclassified Campylobacter]MDA3068127.1 hypothetical protein [Campylobacter sp. CN_NE3]MDA3088295.1 hypothetical protein [Campylobacter sp. CN_EL1]WBR52813.1 hypothetical protein PF028_00100 [Campylobacter sp. CN_NE2]